VPAAAACASPTPNAASRALVSRANIILIRPADVLRGCIGAPFVVPSTVIERM
jgi:hypothetical protein